MTAPISPPSSRRTRLWLATGLAAALVVALAVYWVSALGLPQPGAQGETGTALLPTDGSAGAARPPWFRDMTAASGLHFTYRNGEEADQYSLLETLGGGVALLDYDGDGRLDLFVTGGGTFSADRKSLVGRPCKLYRNLGQWKFEDVTQAAGLDLAWGYTHGVAVADYDRDGWPDLVVTGYGRLTLLHNEPDGKGGRRFVDVTEALGLRDTSWSTSAGWADLDGDGWPDLYVCHYVDWSIANNPLCIGRTIGVKRDICGPEMFKPLVHALFHNEHGKGFRNIAAEQGFRAAGNGLGVVLADLNDDGIPDVFVGNDTNPNFLFLNQHGKLSEQALTAGVAVDLTGHATGSMGVDAADYDGSGRPSLWVTTFQGQQQALYRNLGGTAFRHESTAAGIAALGQNWVGFGTAFVDVDNDGWEDLVFVNGHVYRYSPTGDRRQRPVLLHNTERNGRRFFQDVSVQAGPFFQTPALGRGVAVGDLDNDGAPDLVISHTNTPVTLLRNEVVAAAHANWLGLRLLGRGHRDVIGSTVILERSGRKWTRFVKGGGSYLSASDSRLVFGLGADNSPGRLMVRWSWGGTTQHWDGLQPGRYYELHEGEAEARALPSPSSR